MNGSRGCSLQLYPHLSLAQRRTAQRLLSIARRLRDTGGVLQVQQPLMEESRSMNDSTLTAAAAAEAMEEPKGAYVSQKRCLLRNCNSADLSKAQVFELLESLYRDHPGAVWRAASRRALEEPKFIREVGLDAGKNLVYGEISFIALERLLSMCVRLLMANSKKRGITFYDLGCGSGRVVFAASLLHSSLVKSVGIEILPEMHRMNQELLRLYDIEIAPQLHDDDDDDDNARRLQRIEFVCGDFLKVSWSEADLVFMNATCFDDGLIREIEKKASEELKQESIVITVTKPLCNHGLWEPLEERERRMSWSSAIVFVYRKRRPSHH